MTDILAAELLARYSDARIPRYTSYPTAPHFSAEVDEVHYRSWLASLPPAKTSLYVHIPFCRAMCWYCGCHTTVAAREAPVARYLDCLTREIGLVRQYAAGPVTVSHVHFGGGTPTLIPAKRMRTLMRRLGEQFFVSEDAEIAIEIDPRVLTADMASVLGECGFNRASLGVQSFDSDVQKAINRIQSFAETEAAVRMLRANGIGRINLDLIYGLPNQSLRSCLDTIEQALALEPARFAVFGYAHVPSFKVHQRKIDAAALPGPEARFIQSRAIANALVGAGYVEIGLDHFAMPDDPLAKALADGRLCRNFQGYTTDDADVLIGLGASSIGRLPQGFVQNEVSIAKYQQLIAESRLPVARGYQFKGNDLLRGAIIERLMCDHRVDLSDACRRFGGNPIQILAASRDLDTMENAGLVRRNGSVVEVTESARPFVRVIAAAFDEYLEPTGTYSQAV